MESTVEKNPLISIYRSLNKSEVRRLGKWLDSPVHNQRDDVRALHFYLLGGKDRLLKTSALAKRRIWKHIFLTENYDDARLRQTFHWALKATESFLAYENWQRDPINTQLALVNELHSRNVPSVAVRNLKKAEKLQEQVIIRNEQFFRDQYRLELSKDEFRVHYQLLDPPRFQEIADALDVSYFIEKLKASGNMLFHQRVYETKFDVRFLEEVVNQVKKIDLQKHPVLAIHYYGYRGQVEEDADGKIIGLLRDAVALHGELLSRIDLRYVILMAINLCISKMNRGREPYIRESLEWYKLGLKESVITENGLLTRETYLNVVSIALKLREFEWTTSFISNYSLHLEENIRANTEDFALARLNYHLKDYNSSMQLLVRVDFKHPVYNLIAKTLLMKIYYELDEYDAMDSQLDSMATYIRRKQLSDLHKDHFGNIVRFVRQLSRIPLNDRAKLAELRSKIEAASPLAEKKWLLEQVDKH